MKDLPSVLAVNDKVSDSLARQIETKHEYWTALWRCAVGHCEQIRSFMSQQSQTNNDPYFTAQCNALPHGPTLHEVRSNNFKCLIKLEILNPV